MRWELLLPVAALFMVCACSSSRSELAGTWKFESQKWTHRNGNVSTLHGETHDIFKVLNNTHWVLMELSESGEMIRVQGGEYSVADR